MPDNQDNQIAQDPNAVSGEMDMQTAITKFLNHNHDMINSRETADRPYIDTLDAANVKLTGDQSVAGVKTFASFPVTPSSAPDADYKVANKKYVDDSVAGFATEAYVDTVNLYASASDTVQISNDSDMTPGSDKQFQILIPGKVRLYYGIKMNTGDSAVIYIQIIHGTVETTIHTETNSSVGQWNYYNYDFYVAAGDIISVFMATGQNSSCRLKFNVNVQTSVYALEI